MALVLGYVQNVALTLLAALAQWLIMPQCACVPKAYGIVSLCICNLDFSKVAKNQALVNTVQAQHDNILNYISK